MTDSGPLADVRMLELSRVLAGPYMGRLFSDLGADVIKLEPPEGDQARVIAPRHDRGMSAHFTFANVGKRSLCVDLQRPEGVALVLELVRVCDVVSENFRPGVLDRLGLGWRAIERVNPRVVLVSINGFGSDSAWRERRAYAPIVHAVAGVLQDQADYADQPVAQRNHAEADTLAALHAAVAVLAALREVARTGRGQRVEVPLFDALLTTQTQVGAALLDPPDDLVMNPIYSAGPHGSIATAGPAQHVWTSLARSQADLEDPTPPGAELATKARLRKQAIEAWLASQPDLDTLCQKLDEARLAYAVVETLRAALTGPLARERDVLVAVDHRRGGVRCVVRPAARLSRSSNRVRGRAPRRGEHSAEVLGEILGYGEARIRKLFADRVLLEAPSDEL